MRLRSPAARDSVESGDVAMSAEKQVVEGEQALTIVQLRLGQRDLAKRGLAREHTGHCSARMAGKKWQQDAIKARRLRIHRHDGLSADVLGRVGDQSVLTEGDHQILCL